MMDKSVAALDLTTAECDAGSTHRSTLTDPKSSRAIAATEAAAADAGQRLKSVATCCIPVALRRSNSSPSRRQWWPPAWLIAGAPLPAAAGCGSCPPRVLSARCARTHKYYQIRAKPLIDLR